MIRSWEGETWSFPRGKINKDETDVDCATREVLEEVGFDIRSQITNQTPSLTHTSKRKKIKLYVLTNISEETSKFETRTRKEISEIKWWSVKSLPSMSNSNRAFAEKLYTFCKQHRNGTATGANGAAVTTATSTPTTADHPHSPFATPPRRKQSLTTSNPPQSAPALGRTKSSNYNKREDFKSEATFGGSGSGGWSPEQMFATNESKFGVSTGADLSDDLHITPEIELQLKKFLSPKQIAQLKAKRAPATGGGGGGGGAPTKPQNIPKSKKGKAAAAAAQSQHSQSSSLPKSANYMPHPQQSQQSPSAQKPSGKGSRRNRNGAGSNGSNGGDDSSLSGSGWSAEQMFATNQSKFGVSADQPAEEFQITPEVEAKLSQFFTHKQIAKLRNKYQNANDSLTSSKPLIPPPINVSAAPAPAQTTSNRPPPAQQQFAIPKPPQIWSSAPGGAAPAPSPSPAATGNGVSSPLPNAIASALKHVPVNDMSSVSPPSVSIYDAIIRPMLQTGSQPTTPQTPIVTTTAPAPAPAPAPSPPVTVTATATAPVIAPTPNANSLLQFKFSIDADSLFAAS